MELLFSRKDLKGIETRRAFQRLCNQSEALGSFGRSLLDTALRVRPKEAANWHAEAVQEFGEKFPSRIINNLACCMAGLRLVERLCGSLRLSWDRVFAINLDVCGNNMLYAVQEYLLDGRVVNRSIVEQTLEIMARMGLDPQSEVRIMDDGKLIALRFQKFYDRYTKYRRDHAILGEYLTFEQFKKQLQNSDLFVASRAVRFESGIAKATILNYGELQERCDIIGFFGTDVELV